MEKAILNTLIYASLFDYPLKSYEIHKWLIKKHTSLQNLQKGLDVLTAKGKIEKYKDYYLLKDKRSYVLKRIRNTKISGRLIFKARILTLVLRPIPWIKLIGVSGGLAMENASNKDDIDLLIISANNRIWLTRLFSILLLAPFRRTKKSKNNAGKFCLNIFVDENNLVQRKDLYTAHEILQMKVVWERDGIYGKFLEENEWVFKYLPNWTVGQVQNSKFKIQSYNSKFKIFNALENLAKWFQLKYMGQPDGFERIEDGALYFHPQDCRQRVLDEYRLTVLKYRHGT